MTDKQKASLKALYAALKDATATGALDVLDVHPDTTNAFCDAVEASQAE